MCLRGYLLVTKPTQTERLEELLVCAERVMQVASWLLDNVLLSQSVVVHNVLLHQLEPKLVCHVHCLTCSFGQTGLQAA